jgi:hypothetical protein
MTDLLKLQPNERVDLDDFVYLSESSAEDHRRWSRNVFADTDDVVVSGFHFTVLSSTQLQIHRGVAISDSDNVGTRGQLLTEGEVSQTVSFGGLATGINYIVWVKFTYTDGDLTNRIFWDPSTPEEVVTAVNTRVVEGWSVTVAEIQPGPEWQPLWRVDWNGDISTGTGGTQSTISDVRLRMFAVDGGTPLGVKAIYDNGVYIPSASNNYRSSWGAGTDRDDERSVYGITDLRDFVQAVYKKLDEIQTGTNPGIGIKNWWHAPPNSLDDVLPLSGATGNFEMRGDVEYDLDATYNVGTDTVRPLTIFSDNVDVKEKLTVGGGSAPGMDVEVGTSNTFSGNNTWQASDIYVGTHNASWQGTGTFDFISGDFDFSGTGAMSFTGSSTFTYTATASAKIDNLENVTTVGSFVGRTGNRYEGGYFLTLNGDDVIAVSTFDCSTAAVDWSGAQTTGSIEAATAGSGSIGTVGNEYNQVRAYQVACGDSNHVDNNGLASLFVYASTSVATDAAVVIEIDSTSTVGSVWDFAGFTAPALTADANAPWSDNGGVTAAKVGVIRINSLPGVNSGNPVWIRVYSGNS